jgi:hypothetical protein
MAKRPAYFDSQAQAAATLKIDISDLREAKAEGCPAFRSGRVYTAPLLAWLAEKRPRRAELPAVKKTGDILDSGLADGSETDGELPKSYWDRKKARLDYERALFRFELEKRKYVELDEICASVGKMLAGFRTAVNMLPSSAARWLIGLKDFHAIKSKLESEVDGVLHALGRGRYLEDVAPVVVEKLFGGRTSEFRQDLVKCCERVFIEIGRECFKELQLALDDEEAGGQNATCCANSV